MVDSPISQSVAQDMEGTINSSETYFRVGDFVLLLDRKYRRYLQKLEPTGAFHTHLGSVLHTGIIGQEVGSRIQVGEHKFLALRPTLAEFIVESRRVTQIIYPKDIGAILVAADLFPGARVLESGLGSGAMTMAILRAVGPAGQVFSYEVQENSIKKAIKNIHAAVPNTENLTVRVANLYDGIQDKELDRMVLDVPEPWEVVGHAVEALIPGGIFLAYLPTILQVHRLVEALNQEPQFDLVESFEVLQRPWHVTRRSVRPVHRMVAHTAFLTTARKCAPGKLLGVDDKAEPWYVYNDHAATSEPLE
ncbi:MAG: tRNA (adenine-N1)-methyltransferase [SAR202 cluster bacterium]|nr:tRNA (adenine-N1)-methyltransferase [SAR202 cluster bacterium]